MKCFGLIYLSIGGEGVFRAFLLGSKAYFCFLVRTLFIHRSKQICYDALTQTVQAGIRYICAVRLVRPTLFLLSSAFLQVLQHPESRGRLLGGGHGVYA